MTVCSTCRGTAEVNDPRTNTDPANCPDCVDGYDPDSIPDSLTWDFLDEEGAR